MGLFTKLILLGHSFRRTSASLLVDGGGDSYDLQRHGGWKSMAAASGYIDTCTRTKQKAEFFIAKGIEKKQEKSVSATPRNESASTSTVSDARIMFDGNPEDDEVLSQRLDEVMNEVDLEERMMSQVLQSVESSISSSSLNRHIIFNNCSKINFVFRK